VCVFVCMCMCMCMCVCEWYMNGVCMMSFIYYGVVCGGV
jgi:hypothetical protein